MVVITILIMKWRIERSKKMRKTSLMKQLVILMMIAKMMQRIIMRFYHSRRKIRRIVQLMTMTRIQRIKIKIKIMMKNQKLSTLVVTKIPLSSIQEKILKLNPPLYLKSVLEAVQDVQVVQQVKKKSKRNNKIVWMKIWMLKMTSR